MEIIEQIEHEVAKLDYAWYQGMKDRFESETHFSDDKYHLEYENGQSNVYHDDAGNVVSEEENKLVIIEVTLEQYCWDYNVPGSNNEHVYNEPCGTVITTNIVGIINKLFTIPTDDAEVPVIIDIATKHKIINNIVNVVSVKISELKESNGSNDDYHNALEYILDKFRQTISTKYRKVKQLALLAEHNNSCLNFDMSEMALARLFYILRDAGLLNHNDNTFLNFCQQNFYYTKNGGPIRAMGIKTAFSKIGRDEKFKRDLSPFTKRLVGLLKNK